MAAEPLPCPGAGAVPEPVIAGAVRVLRLQDPVVKAEAARQFVADWRAGQLAPPSTAHTPAFSAGELTAPERPGRLDRPELRAPQDMPRRRTSGLKGRIALLHALAHIELNAVNLALDMVARFATRVGEAAFLADWMGVADDEARHFLMLQKRLADLGASYGDLPAHDGLWEAAQDTAHDLMARLAVVPLVLEARGLDVCPDMIDKLKSGGDLISANILGVIYEDEIQHVRIGLDWFEQACQRQGLPLIATWQGLVRRHFKGDLKPPFNREARRSAGMPASLYEPLAKV